MDNLENKVDEVTFEEYMLQYKDFSKDFVPKMLNEMENRGYMLEVCVLGLSQVIEVMIDMYIEDKEINRNTKEQCIQVIKNGLTNIDEIKSEIKEFSELEE